MDTDVISTIEAAEILGVTPRRILAMIESGKLPAIQMSRFYVIKKSDLALVAERKPGRPKKEAEQSQSINARAKSSAQPRPAKKAK